MVSLLASSMHLLHAQSYVFSFPPFRDGDRWTPTWSVAKPSLTAETVPEPPQCHMNWVWGPAPAVAPASPKGLGGLQARFPSFKPRRTTKDLVTEPVRLSVAMGDLYPFTPQTEKSAVESKK